MLNETSFLNQNDTAFPSQNKSFVFDQDEMVFSKQSETAFFNENKTTLVNQQFWPSNVQDMFFKVNGGVLLVLGATGFVTNVLNIKIFHKLGLDSSINVSFMSLSLADFACACIYLPLAVILLDKSGVVDIGVDLTNSAPFVGVVTIFFTTQGSWANTLISAERCCCVAVPLKVKLIFTKKTTIALIAGMLVAQIAALATNLATFNLTIANPTNNTRRHLDVAYNRALVLSVLLSAGCIPSLICFCVIVMCTVYLGVALTQKSKWLQSAYGQRSATIARNKRLAVTVFWISMIYISCFLPGVIITIFFYVSNEMTSSFGQGDFELIMTSLPMNVQAVSAATNFFVYLKMNSEYRQHLKTMLCSPCAQIRARFF